MNVYIKKSNNQYPISEIEVRQSAYPMALGEVITDDVAESLGYSRVILNTPPTPQLGYYVRENLPQKQGEYYYQQWEEIGHNLENKKAIKLQHFNRMFDQLIGQVKVTYPPTEVESWAKQEKEAREYLADNTSQSILLREIAAARGVSIEWFANKVVSKADQYALVVGKLIGTRQLLEHQILNATEENIDSIKWPPEDEEDE